MKVYPYILTSELRNELDFQRPFADELRTKAFAAFDAGDQESAVNYLDVYHEAVYKADETEAHIMDRQIDVIRARAKRSAQKLGGAVMELRLSGLSDCDLGSRSYSAFIEKKRPQTDDYRYINQEKKRPLINECPIPQQDSFSERLPKKPEKPIKQTVRIIAEPTDDRMPYKHIPKSGLEIKLDYLSKKDKKKPGQ